MAGRDVTAGDMLADIVGDLVARIDERTPAALADEPDAVHQLRTAVRRLRNVLAAFSQYVEPDVVGGLRAQLAEYGDRLGLARDLEVRAAWCEDVATEIGIEPGLRDRLVRPLREEHDRAHAAFVTWSASPRAKELQVALLAWTGAPALANGSARPARAVAHEAVSAQVERVLALAEHYLDDEESAHALRKAGRRLRHTADAVTRPPAAVLGEEVAALGKLGSQLQALLGDHRDALLLAGHLRRSLPAHGDADVRAAFDALIDAAERAAEAAIAAVPAVLTALRARVGRS